MSNVNNTTDLVYFRQMGVHKKAGRRIRRKLRHALKCRERREHKALIDEELRHYEEDVADQGAMKSVMHRQQLEAHQFLLNVGTPLKVAAYLTTRLAVCVENAVKSPRAKYSQISPAHRYDITGI